MGFERKNILEMRRLLNTGTFSWDEQPVMSKEDYLERYLPGFKAWLWEHNWGHEEFMRQLDLSFQIDGHWNDDLQDFVLDKAG